MKLHKICIAAVILAVITMSGCRQDSQTGRQPVSSSFATISSDYSSNIDNTSTAVNEPTTSKGEGENLTAASSEVSSRSSTVVISKAVSSIRSEPPRVSSKPKLPVTSASVSSAGNPSSAQEPDKQEPPAKKDPYAYPFDIEKIKVDLIEYGEKTLNMKHITEWEYDTFDENGNIIHVKEQITPENSSWWGGYVLSYSEQSRPEFDKKQLYDYVKFDHDTFHMTSFTIYVKPLSDGAYQIYVLR